MENLKELLLVNEISFKCDEVLKKYTTYKVGGMAKLIVFPSNIEELKLVRKLINDNNLNYFVLGFGSNLIISEDDFCDVIIKLDNFNTMIINDTTVTVGAGYNLIKLSIQTANNSLSGLEFASGIPGSVGGAVYMNAGAYNHQMSDIITSVTLMDDNFDIIILSKDDMNFGYRDSILKHNKYLICLEITIELTRDSKEEIFNVIKDRKEKRLMAQPLDMPSAGSVFKNPATHAAWKLIADINFRGYQIGGAAVSEKHTNFIVNKDNATANDIKFLIEKIQKEVLTKYNVVLECEQEFVNWK